MMSKLILIVGLFLAIASVSAKAETCEACMAACPHATRDLKPCDEGCPGVCPSEENQADAKFAACEKCMSACPHATRDLKACDRGCPKVCDQGMITQLLLKAKYELSECVSEREPSSAKQRKKTGKK